MLINVSILNPANIRSQKICAAFKDLKSLGLRVKLCSREITGEANWYSGCRSQCLPFFLHKNKPRASSKSSQSLSLWPSPSELNDHDKGCHRRQALTVTSWLHLLIWLLVSGFLCRSRSLQLVEARIESIVPHMVEVDSAQHGDGPHKWDLHAEHWFQAHGLAHVESIAHHGQHGERSRAQDPSNRGVGFGQCSSLTAIRHGNLCFSTANALQPCQTNLKEIQICGAESIWI